MELFQRSALVICRQSPQYNRMTQQYPEDYHDLRSERRVHLVEIDTPSDREPTYQFFGRKRLLLRVPMSALNPVLFPGDTIEMDDGAALSKRFLLANYDPVPLTPATVTDDPQDIAQFVIYEMDQDVTWEQRVITDMDPVTDLQIESAANVVKKVIPITLETLYEERDRSLVTKEDRRRIITGAPLKGGDLITLHGSSDRDRTTVEMKIIRVEYLSGIYICEAQ